MSGQQLTRVDTVFREIFELILSGEIPLGGVVNEAALADRFAVSRGPVREAVKALQGRGLVVKEAYYKARVIDLDARDILEIFQLRESVEGMSVRLATEVMSCEAMDRLLSDFERAGSGEVEFDLHVRIAEECGNQRIRKLLCEELYYLLRLYRARSGATPGRQRHAAEEHWQILRGMKSRDVELAESLMRAHIKRATEALHGLVNVERGGREAVAGCAVNVNGRARSSP